MFLPFDNCKTIPATMLSATPTLLPKPFHFLQAKSLICSQIIKYMSTTIKCPNCGNEFEPNESIRQQIERELNQKATEWQRRKNEEFRIKMEEEKRRIQQTLEENIRKSISLDYENQLRLFEQASKENEEKLRQARQQ